MQRGLTGTARLVAGIDSSTQSTKVVVCDADTGQVLRQGQAPHPDGTEVDPAAWWNALQNACAAGLLDGVGALAVGAQQHGMVLLDDTRQVVRPALLWNDVRSAAAGRDLVGELGGEGAWIEAVGSLPVASFTVTKLRWTAEHEPAVARRAQSVLLPHDWLTSRLLPSNADLVTDRGDASGTGYWSAAREEYRPDLLERAFGRVLDTPRVLGPDEAAGETATGVLVAAGTGDNMAAALGLGAGPGDLVVSVGTSGTAFAAHDQPVSDASGAVAGFADATGRYLPLVATLNAARVLVATARMLGTDLTGLDELALRAAPGAGGLVLLPYLDGERTPDLPHATGTLAGLTRTSMTPENVARAAVEGMLCGLADAVDALRRQGIDPRRLLLTGGGARSRAVQALAPALLGVPVVVPEPAEYVARGAARQAAWVLDGGAAPPDWAVPVAAVGQPGDEAGGRRVREAYAEVRERSHPS
ncbi:MAG: xylulokinase [Frankiaceae bacterium]|nr:xylulokinase [Frankiaceae bacterium]